ncbi:MAG TPA: CheR family methyltransferase [Chloroflexota bacterium]|nr:CheR family methyltransferase [Chloroflexota bacterium]
MSDQLVVIGSSAGGIEALSVVLGGLPKDFPAPVVIAQHIDPNRPSHLADILGRRSALPVRTVMDQETLEDGVVFVVPADRHVSISDHTVKLSSDAAGRPMPSIDLLLSTAAAAFNEQLTAVILTGTGSDGTLGAREVKKAGGTVIIENPETARFPGMPESLAPTTVDVIADLKDIGPLLHKLLTGEYQLNHEDHDAALSDFLQHLREQQGIDFGAYKTPTISRRLQRRIVASGTQNLSEYIEYLHGHPDEYQRLVGSFLIKVTEFFRDPDLFRYLGEHLLPELIAEGRRGDKSLRIWSSGCATGEEAYSLAMLVHDVLGEEREQFQVRIFATDLDAGAIGFARRGRYGSAAVAGMPSALRERYLANVNGVYEVRKDIRALVVFGEHDVAQRAPFPNVDLVLCRNMLIYFTPELQRRVLHLFAFALRRGGYLVLGKSETARPLPEFFATEQAKLKIFQRVGDVVPPPTGRLITSFSAARAAPRPAGGAALDRMRDQRDAARTSGEAGSQRLQSLPIGVAVVDRRYIIQSISTAALDLLGIRTPAAGEDIIHLAGILPQGVMRATIDAAFRPGARLSPQVVPIKDLATGQPRFLQLSCQPDATDGDGAILSAVLVVTDVTDLGNKLRQAESALAAASGEDGRQQTEIGELSQANQELLEANREMAKLVAELRLANDEFALSNTEYQSAMEEVETLNEEVQASNEELETMNEELQATVEELNTTNSDLQARTDELHELAAAREQQRQSAEAGRERLDVILRHMADAVLVVDQAGKPVLANPVYESMFGQPEAALVAQGEDGKLLSAQDGPQQRAARGESFRMEFIVAAADGGRRWFEAAGEPVESAGAETGAKGVVVIRDISDRSIRRLQDEFLGMASHELRTPLTAIMLNLQLLVRSQGDAERSKRLAETSLQQARRLNALVSDLVEPTRFESGKLSLEMQRVDLAQLTQTVIEATQPLAQGQTIRFQDETGALSLVGDPSRLEQVLQNLLTNAIKYAPRTDYIDVSVRGIDGQAELRVRDYGPGISSEEQPRLFSRFYQVKSGSYQGGLGLGLFIAKQLVTAHGGAIEVQSPEGGGAAFVVRLPLA